MDYAAWQEIEPSDCAVTIHADVVALYANLGNIYAWGLFLEIELDSTSGNHSVQESIERTTSSVQSMADAAAELSGNKLDLNDVFDSLEAISECFE